MGSGRLIFDPTYAAAFNNLAVGYDHEGCSPKRDGLRTRAEDGANNSLVRQNFEIFRKSMTGRPSPESLAARSLWVWRDAPALRDSIDTHIAAKLDVSAFQRVFIAGFLAGGTDEAMATSKPLAVEKSAAHEINLRVIDADVLP